MKRPDEVPGRDALSLARVPLGEVAGPGTPCPTAETCRIHWVVDADDRVTCAFCYQRLTRAVLARILAGRL